MSFGSQFEGQSVMAGKAWRREHEAVHHIVLTVREQREMNAGTLSPSPVLFSSGPQTLGWHCPHLG